MTHRKPILCLDFDGVLHSYTSGWQGAAVIPDKPTPGAFNFLYEAIAHFNVQVYSSRSGQAGGIQAMQKWVKKRAFEFWDMDQLATYKEAKNMVHRLMSALTWPTEKPPAMVTIDDRALTFTGKWPSIEFLQKFKPWNKGEGFDPDQPPGMTDEFMAELRSRHAPAIAKFADYYTPRGLMGLPHLEIGVQSFALHYDQRLRDDQHREWLGVMVAAALNTLVKEHVEDAVQACAHKVSTHPMRFAGQTEDAIRAELVKAVLDV